MVRSAFSPSKGDGGHESRHVHAAISPATGGWWPSGLPITTVFTESESRGDLSRDRLSLSLKVSATLSSGLLILSRRVPVRSSIPDFATCRFLVIIPMLACAWLLHGTYQLARAGHISSSADERVFLCSRSRTSAAATSDREQPAIALFANWSRGTRRNSDCLFSTWSAPRSAARITFCRPCLRLKCGLPAR